MVEAEALGELPKAVHGSRTTLTNSTTPRRHRLPMATTWSSMRSATSVTTSNHLSLVVEAVGIENIGLRADSGNYG